MRFSSFPSDLPLTSRVYLPPTPAGLFSFVVFPSCRVLAILQMPRCTVFVLILSRCCFLLFLHRFPQIRKSSFSSFTTHFLFSPYPTFNFFLPLAVFWISILHVCNNSFPFRDGFHRNSDRLKCSIAFGYDYLGVQVFTSRQIVTLTPFGFFFNFFYRFVFPCSFFSFDRWRLFLWFSNFVVRPVWFTETHVYLKFVHPHYSAIYCFILSIFLLGLNY